MRKKNTRLGMAIGYIAFVVSGVFAVIGAIADLFGFAQGVSENKESILGFFYTILSYLVIWWKWALGIAVVIVAVNAYIRWAQKKEMEDRQTRNLSWFDAQRRNTKYSGGEEHLYKIKCFLKQKDADFLWWAVTGVAGIGKTRLVIEALRDEKITGADIQWLRSFDDYREDALKERVDTILEKSNLRNIIIAEDAQIYMDNIGVLIGYIAEKPVIELRGHKIRILLLIRVGEDDDLRDRYKQLASKTLQSILQKTRFAVFNEELKMEGYKEEDISQIVKTYVVNTKKKRRKEIFPGDDQVDEIRTKTIQVLKSERMDPRYLRPLFAMFIADALLAGKDPMSWDLRSVLDYAVIDRQEEFLGLESRDILRNSNHRIFDKIRGIICLAIIREGLTLSELDDIKEDLEEGLYYSGIGLKDYLKEMQMMKGDDIVGISMPDILSEYYVLRTLVIEPDEIIVEWIIGHLCASLKGAEVTRKKIRQDFRYLYTEIWDKLDDFYYAFFERCSTGLAFEIIKHLLSELDLRDSNEILLHEAIGNQIRNNENEAALSSNLFDMINDAPEIVEKRSCLSELRRLSEENAGNADIVFDYSKGLVNMIRQDSEIEEKRQYLSELRRLSEENAGNADIVSAYSKGLVNMIRQDSEIEEKRSCLSELRWVSKKNACVADIVFAYSAGLFSMIDLAPKIEEKRSCLSELRRVSEENADNADIVFTYSMGLFNMIDQVPEIVEKRNCMSELRRVSEENTGNTDFAFAYSRGLVNMIIDAPEIEEKRSCLSELRRLSEENAGNVGLVLEYSKGLFNMINQASEIEEKRNYLSELRRLSEENSDNADSVLKYSMGLFNMITDAPEIEEKRGCLSELRRLSEENAGNSDIVYVYSKGLFNMRYIDGEYYNYYIGELYRILFNKRMARFIAEKEPDIITYTRRELLEYEHDNRLDGIGIV